MPRNFVVSIVLGPSSSLKNPVKLMMNAPEHKFSSVCFVAAIHSVLVGAFFNPWVSMLRSIAIFILVVEAFAIVFWALPIFLYQLVIKRCSWRESLRIAVKSIVDVLSFTGV